MSFFIRNKGFVQKGAIMKSKKKNMIGLLARIKQRVSGILAKVRSSKLPLPRLSAIQFGQSKSKTEILREKYSYSHPRTRSRRRRHPAKKPLYAARKNIPQQSRSPKFLHSCRQLPTRLKLPEFFHSCRQLPARLKLPRFSLNTAALSQPFRSFYQAVCRVLRWVLQKIHQVLQKIHQALQKIHQALQKIHQAVQETGQTLRKIRCQAVQKIRRALQEFRRILPGIRPIIQGIRWPEFLKFLPQLAAKLRFNKLTPYLKSGQALVKNLARRLHLPEFCQSCRRVAAGLNLPKVSLAQLKIPDQIRKHLDAKTITAAVVVLFVGGNLIYANTKVNAAALEIDGRRMAVVTDKAAAEKLISDLKAEQTKIWQRNVQVKQNLAFQDVRARRNQVYGLTDLERILKKNLVFEAVATGVKVNGQLVVAVKDVQVAENILQQLLKLYQPEEAKVESVAFQEKVELVDVPVALADVLPADRALQVLKEGKEKKVTYLVKEGDSLWSIANANHLNLEDLRQANPEIKGERLDLNQKINLTALVPLVNVIATGQITVQENLPYKVVVETNRNLWHGREKVKVRGQDGQREVTYKVVMKNGTIVNRNVLQEKILQPSTNQVVIRGTKYVMASRTLSGGKLGWPISGRITSRFGKRRGGRHTGLDIHGTRGEPVGAAAAGTVAAAGWEGGYGRMVIIRHSNGLVTRYAHLSKIEVSVGQTVDRGDLIGLVGSSGHSTGPHLHFEVISDSRFQNPVNYLK